MRYLHFQVVHIEYFLDFILLFSSHRPRTVSTDSPRSPVGTPVTSLTELLPGTSPGGPKSIDGDMVVPPSPHRGDSNEMSLEEEQLAGKGKGL